jgi:hypothetical protein
MLGREGELKTADWSSGEPSSGLLRDVGGMIVEDEFDRSAGRITSIEKLEEFDELSAAVAVFDRAWTLPVSRPMPAKRLSVPWRLYS